MVVVKEVGGVRNLELVLFVEKDKADDLNKLLYEDDLASRANIIFRDASPLGREGFYVRVLGSEEQCARVEELSKDVAEIIEGEEKEKVLKFLKGEDDKMLSGFSGIFG